MLITIVGAHHGNENQGRGKPKPYRRSQFRCHVGSFHEMSRKREAIVHGAGAAGRGRPSAGPRYYHSHGSRPPSKASFPLTPRRTPSPVNPPSRSLLHML